MTTTSHPGLRELDRRMSDGIDVRLMWDPRSKRVSVAVRDQHSGDSVAFEVSGPDALDAFHHPYAYAPSPRPSRVLARARDPQGPPR